MHWHCHITDEKDNEKTMKCNFNIYVDVKLWGRTENLIVKKYVRSRNCNCQNESYTKKLVQKFFRNVQSSNDGLNQTVKCSLVFGKLIQNQQMYFFFNFHSNFLSVETITWKK
jgi:hypothetical protein